MTPTKIVKERAEVHTENLARPNYLGLVDINSIVDSFGEHVIHRRVAHNDEVISRIAPQLSLKLRYRHSIPDKA
jgi:hypothetical protein